MNNPLGRLLGLCRRAGRLTSGDQAVRKEITQGKVKLLILAENASKRTSSAFNEIAQSRTIPVIIYCSREVLGQILGKPPRSVVAILDEQFARGMLRASGRGEVE